MVDLNKAHQANLLLLKEVDRICRKYRLRYVLDSGTLLGAVRHKGFIPWDDDADVAMTRANFDAFLKVAPRELPEGMKLIMPDEYHDGKGFYDFTPRIIYENSRIRSADDEEMIYYEGKLNHLWVDLFVLDALPDSRTGAVLARGVQAGIYGLAMGHRYALDYQKYSLPAKLAVGILAGIGRLVPMRWLVKLQRGFARMGRKKKTKCFYYSNYQPDYLYVTVNRQWSTETVELPFEDTKLMCPKGWHKVLTQVYGDYRKLPPEDERLPKHCIGDIDVW